MSQELQDKLAQIEAAADNPDQIRQLVSEARQAAQQAAQQATDALPRKKPAAEAMTTENTGALVGGPTLTPEQAFAPIDRPRRRK